MPKRRCQGHWPSRCLGKECSRQTAQPKALRPGCAWVLEGQQGGQAGRARGKQRVDRSETGKSRQVPLALGALEGHCRDGGSHCRLLQSKSVPGLTVGKECEGKGENQDTLSGHTAQSPEKGASAPYSPRLCPQPGRCHLGQGRMLPSHPSALGTFSDKHPKHKATAQSCGTMMAQPTGKGVTGPDYGAGR